MIRYEALVMSETEPVQPGTLWIRKKRNSIKADGADKPELVGFDIWYFGDKGWMPLFDLDTRYTFDINVSTTAINSEPLDWAPGTNDPEHGMVNKTINYNIYDHSRSLTNATNIVVEKGLKYHVDDLQEQINALKARVSTLESKVAYLETETARQATVIANQGSSLSSLSSTVSNLNNRLHALENA